MTSVCSEEELIESSFIYIDNYCLIFIDCYFRMPRIQQQYRMINNNSNRVEIWQWRQHKHHQVNLI
jgi:hypothetical protein